MGLLKDDYQRADHDPSGYGYLSYADAWATIDEDDPPIGETFKIEGMIYILTGEMTFERVEG